jgi:GH15 family glucan-1,4-alpha-glucosidase
MASRIEDYALIGDCETAALVGKDGSVDWLYWPRFDSDACFAALLGSAENGRWLIGPTDSTSRTSRAYRGDSLILETRFDTDEGSVLLVDFMPPRSGHSNLVRLVIGERGRVAMRTELTVRFGYGERVPWVHHQEDGVLRAIAGPDQAVLRTNVALRGEGASTVGDFAVAEDERVAFALTYASSHLAPPDPKDPLAALTETEQFWPEWSGRAHRRGRAEGRGDALADHAEGAHLRADRRHRRSTDHLSAGDARGRPRLGLSLLLAARRHLVAPRTDERRISRKRALGANGCCARWRALPSRPRSCTPSPASGG